jgi:hypothetical protein
MLAPGTNAVRLILLVLDQSLFSICSGDYHSVPG